MSKTPLNSRMIDALAICNALDNAAQIMTVKDEDHWAAWLRYFLQALEQKTVSSEAYQSFLETLHGEIGSRLEHGQW
jgi:N-glycosylase/DNA lyase